MPLNHIGVAKQRAIAQHSEQAGQFAARYEELAADAYRSCFTYSRHRLDTLLARLLPSPADGLRLLDVGCGTGHHLAALRARGFDVAGIDGSTEMVALARTNNPGAVVELGDVETLPFPSASFDVVVSIEVLRYLPTMARCVAEIARVLKPGGICFVTATPTLSLDGYWLVNRVASTIPVRGLVNLRQYFTGSAAFRRELRAAGFGAVDIHGVYFGPVSWIGRLAPSRLPAVLRRWEMMDARIADRPLVREFSNMFLARAVRGAR